MILITGARGQLGSELRYLLDELGTEYVATGTNELDITDAMAVSRFVSELKPDVIYHTAAYTAVDKAEDEGKKLNFEVNVDGTKNVATAAEKVGATFVYISTDYVFDGQLKDAEYEVDDTPKPNNEYGRAKLLGEESVMNNVSKKFLIRTAWVYGNYGSNFVFTMKKLAKLHSTLSIVDDQHGRPTWTRTLAEFMVYLVANEGADNVPYGIYHLTNDSDKGGITWFDFASEILKDSDTEIVPVSSDMFPQKAKRPKYSVMSLSKAKKTGFEISTWKDALMGMQNQID
ncbi:dTDP-4-dehydrorhamnose reductase [Dellaglioa algida]|uniref:dTDP-4-dehydrorhamnose reductase n=1 Tax=Dellaglioa algida DSM 15638 TaxID=1423719 RepID=A0A0R1HQ20_9LACO|nr:dTDP-4-dehydrorhamnose reductase [Dellaglioa algida]KRK45505.1 dTDP-4-dehydrorhamnose reductase RmlD [Dellaglioa algida DSM 15638]MDK1732064.1 dTDP-4-dehydrorhamnose reductase [Dellaglioa algida]MDK1733590.1 dTDP-4-dehydrorhamnose reductase [Dellaglioa algida]